MNRTFSDKWLDALLQEGQHSVEYSLSLSLNVPVVEKIPDTELNKELKRAKRNKLQDAFYYTWIMVGGAADFWQTEYQFHPTRKWRFDFANPTHMIAVEVNGGQWGKSGHSSGLGLQRDAEKSNAALALGWRVYVLTTSMLRKRVARDHVTEILRAVYKGEL
jgi:very-short-patch-repair endonuclease